jgi:hypothetical protein
LPPRVRDAVPVDEQHVGAAFELRPRRLDGRHFSETEQAGHVRERRRQLGGDFLDGRQSRECEHDDRRAHPSVADAAIDAGDEFDPTDAAPPFDALAKALLHRARLGRRRAPA